MRAGAQRQRGGRRQPRHRTRRAPRSSPLDRPDPPPLAAASPPRMRWRAVPPVLLFALFTACKQHRLFPDPFSSPGIPDPICSGWVGRAPLRRSLSLANLARTLPAMLDGDARRAALAVQWRRTCTTSGDAKERELRGVHLCFARHRAGGAFDDNWARWRRAIAHLRTHRGTATVIPASMIAAIPTIM